jgi:hypothetical protein
VPPGLYTFRKYGAGCGDLAQHEIGIGSIMARPGAGRSADGVVRRQKSVQSSRLLVNVVESAEHRSDTDSAVRPLRHLRPWNRRLEAEAAMRAVVGCSNGRTRSRSRAGGAR